jgi:ferredoxin
MDVVVDRSLCRGYGNCAAAAPAYFDLDDSGLAVVLKAVAETEEEHDAVRAAVPLCPMNAIKLSG